MTMHCNLEHETHATLRIMGDDLDPSEVTRALSVEPSFARRKGDIYGNPDRPVRSRTGIWALESEGSVKSGELEEHLRFLAGRLSPEARRHIGHLRAQGYQVDILCYWMSGTGQGGPVLTADVLLVLGGLGAELSFDFYSSS
jgi:hypothetical protein